MGRVTLTIGGRNYDVQCRDGEEDHLSGLAGRIDEKVEKARAGAPGLSEVRQLLFAAILLADEASDLSSALRAQQQAARPAPDSGEDLVIARMNALTSRIESLAEKLAEDSRAS